MPSRSVGDVDGYHDEAATVETKLDAGPATGRRGLAGEGRNTDLALDVVP